MGEETNMKEEVTPGCYIKARHVLVMMTFCAVFNLMALRNNLSVAVVAMVNYTNSIKNDTNSSSCPDRGASEVNDVTSNGQFNWNSAEQGLLLGSYFYGYIWTCIPGGYLSERFGFRPVLGTSMFLGSVITLLTPLVANTSFELFVAFRILLGFVQGPTSPSLYAACSKWAPLLERSKLTAITFSGASFGLFVILPICGVIADNLGWEYVFYITGGLVLLWTFVFIIVIRSSPEEHPRISEQEKKYIIGSQNENTKKKEDVKLRTPWVAMLTSLPLWGIMIAHFAANWGSYTINTMLPTYMTSILGFNLSASGMLSALPYVLRFITTLVGGFATDALRSRHITSLTVLRKTNTSIGLFIPAVFIALAGYIGCNVAAAVAFFTISTGFSGFVIPGSKANVLDIAPKYSGITFGISNTLANIAGFLSPQVAGLMLVDDNSIHRWQNVFWLSAGIYCIGAVTYLILGTAEEQPWAGGKVIMTKKESEIAYIGPLDEYDERTVTEL